jgi:ribosome-associated protein
MLRFKDEQNGKNTIIILIIALVVSRIEVSLKKAKELPAVAGRDFSPEWIVRTSRSRGPGGQNVNKVDTKVEIRFHPASSVLLTGAEKELLLLGLRQKLTDDGFLIITSQRERSQVKNRQVAAEKFYRMINRLLTIRKVRKPTGRTAASKEKRLEGKKNIADKKSLRKKPAW